MAGISLSVSAQTFALKGGGVEVAVDAKGNLTSLKNVQTGQEYAGGRPLWRLYFDRKGGEKEIEVLAKDNVPRCAKRMGGSNSDTMR